MVRIITDSAADFEPWELEEKQISCIPLTVIFGQQAYRENENLSKEQFYQLLQESAEPPKTAQPSPQELEDLLRQAADAGEEAVYITLSSQLSGTYQSAAMVCRELNLNNCFVVDGKNATGGQRLLVEHAVRLRDAGRSAAQIVREIEKLREHILLYACIDTLQYLYQGGRISHTAYKIGTLAQVKPIIRVSREGKVEVPSKAMGMRKGMEFLCKKLQESTQAPGHNLYVMYTADRSNAEALAEKFRALGYPVPETCIVNVGAAIGSHIGPGGCGFVCVTA